MRLSDSVRSPRLLREGVSSCDSRLSMLAGFMGRPLGMGCIAGEPLDMLPFIFAALPLDRRVPFSRPLSDRSDELRVGRLKLGCDWPWDGRSDESGAYGGIIWDSWMVTLIKEAVFPPGPPGSCGEGVEEASFGTAGMWLVLAVVLQRRRGCG